jgi:DnaK suppressor protein
MQPAVERYRRTLDAVDRALTAEIVWKRGAAHIKRLMERLDGMTTAARYEAALQRLNYRSALLLRIRSALRRIAQGGYGTCISCGSEISSKRLLAVPWAAFCAACRRSVDEQGLGALSSLGIRRVGSTGVVCKRPAQ